MKDGAFTARLANVRASALVVAAALTASCAHGVRTPAPTTDVAKASGHYRASRDYVSLETVARGITAGTSRAEVEQLLGEPTTCFAVALCAYASDRLNDRGDTIYLAFQYSLAHEGDASSEDRVGRSWLMPLP